MIIINFLVIYFAFGVPFGVLAASQERGRFHQTDLWRIVYDLAFWPVVMLKTGPRSPDSVTIGSPELDFEARALRRQLGSEIEILKGLRNALRNQVESNKVLIPFDGIIDHPNIKLAAKCLQRSNLSKLNGHIAAAEYRVKSMVERSVAVNVQVEEILAASGLHDEFSKSRLATRA
jgi:hypothetical protein